MSMKTEKKRNDGKNKKNGIRTPPQGNNRTEFYYLLVCGGAFVMQAAFGETEIGEETETTPEQAVKIGSAFAALCGSGQKIGIGSGEANGGAMLRYALTAGLMAGGARVVDFGEQPKPVTRAAVRFYGLGGGVHVTEKADGKMTLCLMEKTGADLREARKEKLERLLQSETVCGGHGRNVKNVLSLTSYSAYYLRDLLGGLRNTKLRYRLLIHAETETVKTIVTSVLSEVSCTYKLSAAKDCTRRETLEKLRLELRGGSYDFGAYLDGSGERLTLITEDGTVVPRARFYLLTAYMLLKRHKGTAYIAAEDRSAQLEFIAKQMEGKVVRTQHSPLENMTGNTRESLREQFVLEYDAVGGLVKLLDFLKEEGKTLREILERLPQTYFSGQNYACDAAAQNRFLHHLTQSNAYRTAAVGNGVKLYEEGGWVLILPHKRQSFLRIVSEGVNMECAEELTLKYRREAEKWT